MHFYMTAATDVGLVKKVNQDSYTMKRAVCQDGELAFAVICDGMGGFSNGELASGSVIELFSKWFTNLSCTNPKLLDSKNIFAEWGLLAQRANDVISKYGIENGIRLGTTITAILLMDHKYYCINVGDSRAYMIRGGSLEQLTKDQTLVQREIDSGIITAAQAEIHPQRNVLLQCIGCNSNLEADFYEGDFEDGISFLLCSDGFRHEISPDEIVCAINNEQMKSCEALEYLINANKQRGETDNITALLINCME